MKKTHGKYSTVTNAGRAEVDTKQLLKDPLVRHELKKLKAKVIKVDK